MTTQLPDIDVILGPAPDLDTWRTIPRELEQDGFHGVVCPDNPWSADPFQLMAIAASVTSTLRLGTHVLAAPLREPAEVVDQTRSLVALSGDRFGLGLGTGLPAIHEHARRAGRPVMDGRASRDWIAATAHAMRAAESTAAVPVTVAAGGPRAMEVAAAVADQVALPLAPTATTDDVERMVRAANRLAGQRDRALTFVVNPIGAGDRLVGFHRAGLSAAQLRDEKAFALLPGRADDIAETLASWRADFGIERVVVADELRDVLAEVLRGT